MNVAVAQPAGGRAAYAHPEENPMSLRTTMIAATTLAVVATGGILAAPADAAVSAAPASAKCTNGHGTVREGTVMHTRLGTWVCRKGRWAPPQ